MKKIIYLLLILFALVTPVPTNDEVNVIPRKMEPFTVINVVNGEIQVEKGNYVADSYEADFIIPAPVIDEMCVTYADDGYILDVIHPVGSEIPFTEEELSNQNNETFGFVLPGHTLIAR